MCPSALLTAFVISSIVAVSLCQPDAAATLTGGKLPSSSFQLENQVLLSISAFLFLMHPCDCAVAVAVYLDFLFALCWQFHVDNGRRRRGLFRHVHHVIHLH